jgi:murein DD-endopeptidase MepM/ murein hydrolase activator NlpD
MSWRALAGAIVLAGTLLLGALSPAITSAQSESGGYIGFDTPSFSAGQSVVVRTDDGGGLTLRDDASLNAEQIGALGDGSVVRVVAGPYYDDSGNGWYLVTDGSIRAFAYAGFLAASSSTEAVYTDEGTASTSTGYLGYTTPDFAEGQTVVVQTDDGGGLSLRLEPSSSAEKLSAAADGSTLTIVAGPYTDSAGNGWYLVTNGPLRAYAFAGFLVAGSSATATSSASSGSTANLGNATPQFSAGQSVIVQTDTGGGLSLRLEPSMTAEKLDAARDGDTLTIVEGPVYDDANNGWYLVTSGPLRAWAYGGFLVAGGSSAESASSSSSASGNLGAATPQFSEGQLIVVQTDDGGGLSLRMEPSLAADKLVAVKDGTTLRVVQGPVSDDAGNGWYLVTNGALRAYAYAGFLVASGSSSSSTTTSSTSSSGNLGFETPQFSAGQTVAVQTDTGGGLSLRMDANSSSEQLLALKEGVTLTIVMGPEYDSAGNGWYLVTNGSIRAFAFGAFLVPASAPQSSNSSASSSSSSSAAASSAASLSIGSHATTSGVTNVRNGATANGTLLGTFSGGDVVEITDGPFYDRNQEPWYYIVGDSVQGFAKGEFLIATAAPAAASSSSSAPFIYPLAKYTFTQDYGCSSLGFYSYNAAWGCAVHNGIDLAAPMGTAIMAAGAGTVAEAGWCDCGLGYYVKIDHGNGLSTWYGHMQSSPYVRVGQTVAQGETIGPVGSTGLSTGPHVHFMVQKNGVTVDPKDYL